MIAKPVVGGGRDGVDRVRSDQLFDVDYIAQLGVLGRSGRPQHALRLRILRLQFFPARSGEELLVRLIGQLGVRYRNLALQPFQFGLVAARGEFLVDQAVGQAVNAADEETRHARGPADVALGCF